MSSNFIIWVIKEIDKYISIFKNQVLKSKSNFSIARECIETTNEQIMMVTIIFVIFIIFNDIYIYIVK